jgi:DNA-binding response OmpR family regulator
LDTIRQTLCEASVARVLVVDDNPDTCELLARVLRRAGHDAHCQTSARGALDYLQTNTPDLVILDVMMPGMNGLEVLRSVRASPRTAAMPVVLFTALSDARTRAEARRLGASGYVVKGAGWAELHVEIQKHVGRSPFEGAGQDDAGASGP